MRYSNENHNKANGVVYTPTSMANYLAQKMKSYFEKSNEKSIHILDPAVGQGELLVAMIRNVLPDKKHIIAVGYETDDRVAAATQARLESEFPNVTIDIRTGDFLEAVEAGKVGKYDYVIANPPYIRTQIMGSKRSQEIAERLSLSGRIDIYYAFLIYTKDILKENGIAGYITSNKFMTIKAGASIRNYIFNTYHVYQITDLGDTKLFNASVLPSIMVFALGKTLNKQEVHFTSVYEYKEHKQTTNTEKIDNIFDAIEKSGLYSLSDGHTYKYQQGTIQSISPGDLWTIDSDDKTEWLSKVESHTFMTFSQIGKIRVGIKTTADNVFIGDNWTGDREDIELLKPLITHRNAGQIVANQKTQWKVLYTHTTVNGKKKAINLDDFPKSKTYLQQHYEQLSKREYVMKAKRNWFEIWVPQNPDSWAHKKIVFRDISEKPEFWYDATGAVVNGDCYWIDINSDTLEDIIYLALAVANSRFIEKYYDIKFNTKLYSGKRRFQTQYVEQFPLPYYASIEAQQAISIVKKIIAGVSPEEFTSYKDQLDSLVNCMFTC